MQVSIRRDICNDRPRLTVYRPRARAYTLGGYAFETQSLQWIVALPNQPMDVACTEQHAHHMLQSYFDKLAG